MLTDYETGGAETHKLVCENGHPYQAIADEFPECPVCGAFPKVPRIG